MTAYIECKLCGEVFMPQDYNYDYREMNEAMKEHAKDCKGKEERT